MIVRELLAGLFGVYTCNVPSIDINDNCMEYLTTKIVNSAYCMQVYDCGNEFRPFCLMLPMPPSNPLIQLFFDYFPYNIYLLSVHIYFYSRDARELVKQGGPTRIKGY